MDISIWSITQYTWWWNQIYHTHAHTYTDYVSWFRMLQKNFDFFCLFCLFVKQIKITCCEQLMNWTEWPIRIDRLAGLMASLLAEYYINECVCVIFLHFWFHTHCVWERDNIILYVRRCAQNNDGDDYKQPTKQQYIIIYIFE